MQLEDIQESDSFYVYQNIVVPFLIYSAVALLYQGTGNLLEIFYEFILCSLKMYLH
jgi:hypothetical protein